MLCAVVGGLIGARVDRRLAAVSSWYRARNAAALAKREGVIAVLAANPQLLAVAYLDALIGVLVVATATALFVLLRNMVPPSLPEVAAQSLLNAVMLILLAVVLMIVGYFVSRRISTAQEAWKRLGQANGLPKFW